MNWLVSVGRWFGGALTQRRGTQVLGPSAAIVEDTVTPSADAALQLSTVWRCVELLTKIIGTLPLFLYQERGQGLRELARMERLYKLLHDRPNPRMTASEFWGVMLPNWLLRGNAYARLVRDARGEVLALWPLPADQVQPYQLDTGELAYVLQVDSAPVVLLADEVLHLKDFGNGTVGLSRLEFMRASTTEAFRAQAQATRTFRHGNKPTGVLTTDRILTDEQRETLRRNFGEIAQGSTSRLYVLEADLKFTPISLTPEDAQLLQTRQFGIEELCRWFGVPPVLVGHSNVTAWGTGVEQIIEGFYKLTVRPMLVQIEQAVNARVLTDAQRARLHAEFSFDALLRSNAKDRFELYAKGVQNGLISRNEVRQLENLPPIPGAGQLTAQSNLVPLDMLGKIPSGGVRDVPKDPVAQ